jgi:hypothetical protein
MKARLNPLCLLVLLVHTLHAQESTTVDQRLQSLSNAVVDMQQRLVQSQRQIDQLNAEVQSLRKELAKATPDSDDEETTARLQAAVSDLKDDNEVLQSEVKQHEQTKLETASKYPVKVTGVLLFSSFLNNGQVDNIDDPVLAYQHVAGATNGSFAATIRQSVLGLDATGPELWGARSSADLRIDFFGGLAYADYNTSAGIVRLRTAHARLDWPNHSVAVALDAPLISPLSPTSFLSVGEPALAWSGNLWAWSPQLQVRNRTHFRGATLNYDFGLIDPSAPGPPPASGSRQPDAAEQSRQPGYQFHGSYAVHVGENNLEIGAGGYYSRQAYSAQQHVDAWAGTADWLLPLGNRWEMSGEFYRGRAIGGLGGGGFKDVVTNAVSGTARGLSDEGGWAQVKFRFSPTLEANAAFGQDNPFASELYDSAEGSAGDPYSSLARNRTTTANIIYRPKTYLLFSSEFRYLQSWPASGKAATAPVIGFGAGYLF